MIMDLVTRKWICEVVSGRGDRPAGPARVHARARARRPARAGRRPPAPARRPDRRRPRAARPARRQRQRAADDQRLHPRVPGHVRDRAALRPPRHPDRSGLDREPVQPHQGRLAAPGPDPDPAVLRAELASVRHAVQHAVACTPASATSPPTTNTKAAARQSARPAAPACTAPAAPRSPTIERNAINANRPGPRMRSNRTPDPSR